MGILKNIFTRHPSVRQLVSTDSVERALIRGIGKDAMLAALIERQYMGGHPCKCGGEWERIGGGSAYPNVYSNCICNLCGAEKRFEFRLA